LLLDKIADLLQRADELSGVRRANREWVLEHYSFRRTASALTAAVDAMLARPGGRATARHPAASIGVLGPHFTAFA
jgi:hypothetical protein